MQCIFATVPPEIFAQDPFRQIHTSSLPVKLFGNTLQSLARLIKRSLQGVMYSVTIRLGLNPSAKDRRWSLRKKLIFSRKIPRRILGGMPVHLHICRPRSLVDREIRRTYTFIIDSLPVLGMVQINHVGWAILGQVSRKIRERPAKGQGACCKVPRIASKRKWQGRMTVTACT